MSNSRNLSIDIARGIAIILVVIGHVIQNGSMGNFDFRSNPVFETIYTFHMPLFIFLSGYVSVYSIKNRSPYDLIKKRFLTLIIPFLSWSVVMYFYYLIGRAAFGHKMDTNLFEYVLSTILNPAKGLWFLWVLFFLNVFLVVINKISMKHSLISSIVLYLLLLIIPSSGLLYFYMIKWLYPFFFVGFYLSLYQNNLPLFVKPFRPIFSLSFPFLYFFWSKSDNIYISEIKLTGTFLENILVNSYRYLIGFAGITLVFYIVKSIKPNDFLVKGSTLVGKYSLDIYAIHVPFLLILTHLPRAHTYFVFNLIYVPIVSVIITILCILISKYIIGKTRFLKILLLGGR